MLDSDRTYIYSQIFILNTNSTLTSLFCLRSLAGFMWKTGVLAWPAQSGKLLEYISSQFGWRQSNWLSPCTEWDSHAFWVTPAPIKVQSTKKLQTTAVHMDLHLLSGSSWQLDSFWQAQFLNSSRRQVRRHARTARSHQLKQSTRRSHQDFERDQRCGLHDPQGQQLWREMGISTKTTDSWSREGYDQNKRPQRENAGKCRVWVFHVNITHVLWSFFMI